MMQPADLNSVSLNDEREKSGAIADYAVQHWICHDAETKRVGSLHAAVEHHSPVPEQERVR